MMLWMLSMAATTALTTLTAEEQQKIDTLVSLAHLESQGKVL